jgi:hypothetical protein
MSTTAIVSLAFGVVCWVGIPFVGALVAVICGHAARAEIRRASPGRSPSASEAMDGRERPPGSIDGEALAIAGMILGYAHLALIAFLVILVFGFLGGLAFFSHWHS